MRIDPARHDIATAGIDHLGAGRRFEIVADRRDHALLDENIGAARMIVIDDGAAANELGHLGVCPVCR